MKFTDTRRDPTSTRYKQSGIGRELGSYALDNYTQVKTVLWDYSDHSE